MKTFAKRSLSALLVLIMLVSALSALSFTGFAAGGKNQGVRHQVCTSLSDQAVAYYKGDYTYENMSALQGGNESGLDTLKSPMCQKLSGLMSDTMENHVSYNSLPGYWDDTDATGGSSTYVLFYGDKVGGKCNREHVWPKSHGSFYKKGAGCDLHHLRPADTQINSDRYHWTMGDVKKNSGSYTTSQFGGRTVLWVDKNYKANDSDGLVEVNDNIKGDVARIFLYVYCRWSQPNLFENYSGKDLPAFDSDDDANDGHKVIENLDTLLEWCEMDPVDDWEMGRNDKVQDIQGNRNVFIDYPEFAWLLFGQEVPSDMKTPSGEAQNAKPAFTLTATSGNDAWGTVEVHGRRITAVPAEGYYASGYEVLSGNATVSQNGNFFTVEAEKGSTVQVQINFAAKKQITVAFAGAEGVSPRTCYAGDEMTLPTATAPEGYTFVGWTEAPLTEDVTEKPEVLTAPYIPTGNTTLHALYSYIKEGTDTGTGEWKLAESSSLLGAGAEIVITSYANHAVAGDIDGKILAEIHAEFSDDHKTMTSLPADALVLTVGGTEGAWTLANAEGNLLGATSTKKLAWDSGTTSWDISIQNGTATITNGSGAFGRFLFNTSASRFTTSPSSVSSTMLLPEIYIKDGTGGTRYYTSDAGFAPDHFNSFTDCTDEWYHEAVNFVVENDLMGGTGKGIFAPAVFLTRGMVVTVLYRNADSPDVDLSSNFVDVPANEWYAKAAAWARKHNVVNGVDDQGHFAPEDNIKREDLAVILWRSEKSPVLENVDMSRFADTDAIDGYAADAMAWAVDQGILNGDNGMLKPQGFATRAEFACMIMRYLAE